MNFDLVDAFLIGVVLFCFVGACISTGNWLFLAIVLAPAIAMIHERFTNGE